MAEKAEQNKKYEYRQNSNLVLQSSDRAPRGDRDGPTGEVSTLVGKVSARQMVRSMGDRAVVGGEDLAGLLKKAKKKREIQDSLGDDETKKKRRKIRDSNVLTATAIGDNSYRPQTRDTKAAYEALLAFVQKEMGDQPHDVIRSAAGEIIEILKDDSFRPKEKQKEVEQLFRRSKKMDEATFARLVNIGAKITDYRLGGDKEEEKMDEQLGVPVVFEEEEEEEEDNIDEIKDEYSDDDRDEEDKLETARDHALVSKSLDNDMDDEEEADKDDLDVHVIDAFWLQRELNTFYSDAIKSQKFADDVFSLLSSQDSDGAVENRLVQLLDYDKFSFVKILLKNRLKIVYCTRLKQAKDEAAIKAIQEEMANNDKARPILDALQNKTSFKERTAEADKRLMKAARREARNLAGTSGIEETEGRDEELAAFWKARPKAIIDLEAIKFDSGSHFMSNLDCKLPKNSELINKKGYKEVHIPPLKPMAPGKNEKLIKIADLPEWSHKAFNGMTMLNRVQSKVYECGFKSAENMLICAPTGAGKTNVAMLTMLREIGLHRNSDGKINTAAFKIVYVAPMKSLVQEMVLNFGKRLAPFNVKVRELSGDQQLTKAQIADTQVIVTTPEKWDIITRKSGERTYTQLVRLIIIDEIHLLHDSRGPVLESIVARTIRQVEATQELIRLVGLSATLPNYEDVAMFLRVKPDKGLFFFDNSFRPCPLQQQYVGITQKKAFKRHDMINQITYEKVMEQAGQNQILVFVHSRKETAMTATALKDMAIENEELGKFLKEDSGRRELLQEEAESVKSSDLKELLPYGFGIHHAGMTRADRTLVEELFSDNHIQVLVCTATLAWGVNLPAHTVIIKGTQVYNPEQGCWTELSALDVMQMLGRSGRPQYDTNGEGIIITSHKELHYYLSLLNEQLPIESQYISKLADNLNAEIVLGTISNVKEAVEWIGYLYLYVRMLRRPTLYGVSAEEIAADPTLEQRRIDLIHTAASILDKGGLIKYDRKSGTFATQDLGRVASHYYITHNSMTAFNEYLKPNMSDVELFRVFSLSSEFKYMSVREEEKLELSKLLDKVPIPVKESIEEASAKVNVLLQAYISRLGLEGFALISDMVYITQSAGRIMRALFEIVLKRGWASAAVKCLNLCKMISKRMWGAQSPLRQFKGIPGDIIKRIEGKDFAWERFYDLEAHAIGELIRFPRMGRKIHKSVHHLPRLELQGHVQPITRTTLRVELVLTPDFQFDPKVHGLSEPFWILVEDVDGETILHHEFFLLKQAFSQEEHSINFTIPIFDPMPPQYFVRVVSDRWLGSEVVLPISFRHLFLPEKYPAPTELLDLQPLKITDLTNEKFIKYYAGRFDFFNPIQTQCFNTAYKRDDSFLVAAPTGSGKTVLAELAIMRMLTTQKGGRCVYIAPMQAIAQERYNDWQARFGKLGVKVTMLIGETSADLRLLADSQLVISTPKNWDVLSRRWKTRKNVQNVKLFIVDEMHLIGGDIGPTLEVIISRMRYISSQTENPLRIAALSTSVANARDLGEWCGCKSHSIFSFHPNVRPVPLEIRIQGFDITHFASRQLAMMKPCFNAIKNHSVDKPVLIFVPSREQARRVAADLMTYSAMGADENPLRFLHVEPEDLAPHLAHVSNSSLKETLNNGIGFYHQGMSNKEKAVVEKLYSSGAVQVCVVEHSLCWGLTLTSHLTIVMGTQYYEGRDHRYVDYPITDIVQMMGRAARPLIDTSGKCTIFCQQTKKEFYKKFLYEPFPVESHLDHYLADHLNAEIITKRVEKVQDAVDYLTWSFFYRRLTKNPNYYNLQGVSHAHLSDHLSELTENTLDDLQQSKCISIEDEELSALNLGMIAAFYYIRYTTVELFSSSLTKKTKLKGLLEVLSAASEFESIPVRHKEDNAMRALARHLPLKITEAGNYNESRVKTNVLIQAHFSRIPLQSAVAGDLKKILPDASRLLQAIVDVISSNGWLSPALAAMELSQMITQGLWNKDSALLQLPHFTKEMADKCEAKNVESVPDLMELEDDERNELLGKLSPSQMSDVAVVCNSFPDVELTFEVEDADDLHAGGSVELNIQLIRDPDDDEDDEVVGVPKVSAPRYPVVKTEGWWLVVGNAEKNELVAIKRLACSRKVTKAKVQFTAPAMGTHNLKLFLMSDSYMGVDQEYSMTLEVKEGEEESESDDSDADEDM